MWRTRFRPGMVDAVIVVQRVRVRWAADERGAAYADLRRGVAETYPLPSVDPAGFAAARADPIGEDLLVHEVFADSGDGYRPASDVRYGARAAESARLRLERAECGVRVIRTSAGAAYPPQPVPTRLFVLRPGEVGRYRANFRFWFTACTCAPYWIYEAWTVHIAYAPARPDLFTEGSPAYEVDHRVHLYGGRARRSAKSNRRAA